MTGFTEGAMAFFLKYDQQIDGVMAEVSGKLTPALMDKMAARISELFELHNCRKIVNDMRKAKISNSAPVLRAMADALDNNCPRDTKRALVVTEKGAQHESFEVACFNRGHLVRFFTDLEEARSWMQAKF